MPPSAICYNQKCARCPKRLPEAGIFNSTGFPIDHLFWALDSFNIGIGVFDRRLRFRAVNRALAEINGLPADDHLGRPLHEVVGTLVTKVGSALEHVFSTGQPLPNVKLSGKLPMRAAPGQWIDYYFPLLGLSNGRVLEAGVFVWEVKSRAEPLLCSSTPTVLQEKGLRSEPMLQADLVNPLSFPKADRAILSERELQVLRLLATGKCNKAISAILGISVKTVESHRARVMLKIQAPSLVHVAHYAIRHGFVELQG